MNEKKKRFIENGLVLSGAALLMRTVSVTFGAYLSLNMGAEGMGLYSLIMSVYTFALTFATSGVQLGTTRLCAEAMGRGERGEVKAALRACIGYALAFGGLAALVLFCGAGFFGRVLLGDFRAIPSLRLLAFSLPPIALVSVFSGYFIAVRRVGRNAALSVLEQLLRIGITVLCIRRLLPLGLEYACLALVIGNVISEVLSCLALLLLYLFDVRRFGKRCGKTPVGPLLEITLPVAASSYVRSALTSAEHLLIPVSLTKGGAEREEVLSSYGTLSEMALPIVLYPMAAVSSFAGLLVPEFAESRAAGREEENRARCERAMRLTLWFSLAVAGILAAFARDFGELIYRSAEAGLYIGILAPLIPIMYLDHVTDAILKGLGYQVYSMSVNIIDALISLLLVLWLLPYLGVTGYAYIIIAAEILNFGMSIAGLSFALPHRASLLRAVLYPLASVLTSVTAVKLLLPGAGLILKVLLSALLYLILLLLFCQEKKKKSL